MVSPFNLEHEDTYLIFFDPCRLDKILKFSRAIAKAAEQYEQNMMSKEAIYYLVNTLITSIDQSISKCKPPFSVSVIYLQEHNNVQMNNVLYANQWANWTMKTRIGITQCSTHHAYSCILG